MSEMFFSALAISALLISVFLFTGSKDKAFKKGYAQAVRDILQKGDLEISRYDHLLDNSSNGMRLKSVVRMARFFYNTVVEATRSQVSSYEIEEVGGSLSSFIEQGEKKLKQKQEI